MFLGNMDILRCAVGSERVTEALVILFSDTCCCFHVRALYWLLFIDGIRTQNSFFPDSYPECGLLES
jgi:hypothetical protein